MKSFAGVPRFNESISSALPHLKHLAPSPIRAWILPHQPTNRMAACFQNLVCPAILTVNTDIVSCQPRRTMKLISIVETPITYRLDRGQKPAQPSTSVLVVRPPRSTAPRCSSLVPLMRMHGSAWHVAARGHVCCGSCLWKQKFLSPTKTMMSHTF